jgi:hypothetical protein
MSMSLLDVVPLPGGARKSLQERSVEPQQGTVAVEAGAVTEAGGAKGFPEKGLEGVVSRPLVGAMLGLPAAVLSTAAASLGEAAREVVSCGFEELDQLLPGGGIRRGSLLEWLPAGGEERHVLSERLRQAGSQWKASDGGNSGSGAVTLALAMAVHVVRASAGDTNAGSDVHSGLVQSSHMYRSRPRGRRGQSRGAVEPAVAGTVLVVDRSGWFYPPAVMPWLVGGRGSAARVQLIVARPSRDDDEIWAIDQALRCGGVSAVVACPAASVVCSNVMRRWQLAARASGAVGVFIRSWPCRRDPSWAEVRLVVTPLRRPGCTVESGRVGQLPDPPVTPRSEAVLRQWRVERLSSLLYGEGRSCEVMLDLERGVEPPRAASMQAVRLHRMPQPSQLAAAVLPAGFRSAESQQAEHPQEVACELVAERELCGDVLPLRESESWSHDSSGKTAAQQIHRKDGVACRAS